MTLNEHRRKVLRKLNFKQNKGTKHERWILKDVKTGKPYVVTYVSRSNQDIGGGLLKAICDQLYISKNQYRQIAACTMSKEEYFKHLVDTDIA